MNQIFIFKNVVYSNYKFNETHLMEKEFEDIEEACEFAKQMTGKGIYYINCDGTAASIKLSAYEAEGKPVQISLGIEEKGVY